MRLSLILAAATLSATLGLHCSPSSSNSNAGPLGQAFEASAQTSGVPISLLYAIADVEQGFEIPLQREVHDDDAIPVAGPLMLRHAAFDSLAEAARSSGHSELRLRERASLALQAGAQLLAARLHARGALREGHIVDFAALHAELAEWSGYLDTYHQRDYARRVLASLARGGRYTNQAGETLQFAPLEVPPSLLVAEPAPLAPSALPEYPGAEVFPINPTKPNKIEVGRPDGASIDYVVIHDTEAGWDSSVATLQNSDATSVHYIVSREGRVGQFMSEDDTGKHCGNLWYNRRSIGIEHVGWSTQVYPEVQYAVAARLVAYITEKYAIPKDRAHVFGHDQTPSDTKYADGEPPCMKSPVACQNDLTYGGRNHHTDPGVWEWGTFMPRFGGQAKCNDVTTTLRCDSTGTRAVGCLDGETVTVKHCSAGCIPSSEAGADATCWVNPADQVDASATDEDAGEDADTRPVVEAGAPTLDAGNGGTHHDAAAAPAPDGPGAGETAEAGGCNLGGVAHGSSAAWWLGGLALAFTASRRRFSPCAK